MRKEMVKEVGFGKATARITVTMFTETSENLVERVFDTTTIEIVSNGKVMTSGNHASVLEFSNLTESLYKKAGLDVTKKYTRVGDKAITGGDEAGIAINKAVDEMKSVLSEEFNVVTEKEERENNKIIDAQEVVEQAKKDGVENLMTVVELKAWKKRYNDVNNEGGEGYIPDKVSREQYEQAINFLNKNEVSK